MLQGIHVGSGLPLAGPSNRRGQHNGVDKCACQPPRRDRETYGGSSSRSGDPQGSGNAPENQGEPSRARWPAKPLKINTDLALYRSRTKRIQSQRMFNPQRKKEFLSRSESGFREVIRKDPSDGRAYVGLGKLLVRQRRFDEARKVYEEGCAATEGVNAYLWTAWGILEARNGTPPKARTYFDAAIYADKTHQAAWHAWGMLEEKQGYYGKARDCWIRGLKIALKENKEPSEYLYCSLAMLAYRLGKIDEARKWFMKGTQTVRGSESYALWHGWGKMEADSGIPSAAPKLFERALEVNPRSRYTYVSLAMLEKSKGNLTAAKDLLIKANSLNTTEPAILQALGVLEGEMGNIEEAREIFERGTKISPNHQHLWQAWGVMEYRQGNIERARELFQQGIWAEPSHENSGKIFLAWGVLESAEGNIPLARELLKCGVNVDPRNSRVWGSWISLEEKLGAYQRADELRNMRAQQEMGTALSDSFTTLIPSEKSLEPFFDKVSDWFESVRVKSRRGLLGSVALQKGLSDRKTYDNS